MDSGSDRRPANAKRPFLSPRYIPLLVALLLAALLSLLLPDFFRQVILAPVLSRLVVLYALYRGLPQNVVWGIIAFLTGWIMLYALRPSPAPVSRPPEGTSARSRLSQLANMAAGARTGQHARWELAREIQQVALSLMQTAPDETAASLRQRLERGDLQAPAEIGALLDLCASLPNYRSFLEAREAAPNQTITQLAQIDLEATVTALVRWQKFNWEQR